MEKLKGSVVSVHIGKKGELGKEATDEISSTIEGIQGDRHFGYTRWSKSKECAVRNDRQWTALSVEEVDIIRQNMELRELAAETLGPNIVVQGIPEFSQLPRGTKLLFENGAIFVVEEFTDPCSRMGQHIADKYKIDANNQLIKPNLFPKASNNERGLVGVIDRPGIIKPGDAVEVVPYESKFGK